MTHAERHWASVLNEAWGIDAVLQPLPGEFDLNFLATARDGSGCVLKVMREGCDAAFVSLLCAAHAHVTSASRAERTDSANCPGLSIGTPAPITVRSRARCGVRVGYRHDAPTPVRSRRIRNYHINNELPSCPSWDRTRTLLIQSHACRAAGELDFPKWGPFGVHFAPKRPNGRPLGGRSLS